MNIKTNHFQCWKGVGGEGEMVSCSYKRKTSEVYMHPSSIILQNVDCKELNGTKKCSLKSPRPFVRGQKWSNDFDYCGMLESGKNAKISDGTKQLNKLFDSYEDVNYHEESAPLIESINLISKGKRKLAEAKLKDFNKLSGERLNKVC